jgi:2'-5' RNA ligase
MLLLESPKFGCLMLMLSATPSEEILQWSRQRIRSEDLAEDGYEQEPHVTVLYGFHPDVQPTEIEDTIKDFGPVTIELGAITRFESEKHDVLKIDIDGGSIFELNAKLVEAFAGRVTNKFPEYHPHMTLAYVKKGLYPELNDDPQFFGRNFTFDIAIYSTAAATTRYLISLDSAYHGV